MNLHPNIRILSWFNFFVDFKFYSAIIILYFARVTHSYALGASIFSLTFISAALLDVPTGIFADRVGRKRTVILGGMTGILYAVAYAIGANYWFLALGGLLEGASRAFYSGNNNALLHNLLADAGIEQDYHRYAARFGAMEQIGLATSAIIGGIIANWSFAYVMWLSVVPQIVCLILILRLAESKKVPAGSPSFIVHFKDGVTLFVHNANLRLLSIDSIFTNGLGEASYQFQPAFFTALLPLWLIGLVRAFSNIGAVAGFHFSEGIIARFGAVRALFWGEISSKVLNFAALLFPTVASPFMLTATSFSYGTGTVASESLMQREFTDAQRATMSSLNSFAGSLCFGIFTFIAGLLVDRFGIRAVLLIMQLLLLPSSWFVFRLLRRASARDS